MEYHGYIGLLLILIVGKSLAQTYRAAVVSYKPERFPNDFPQNITIRNKEIYVIEIEKVKDKADIIIFPELGLTTIEPNSKSTAHLEAYAIIVPDPESGFSCANNNNVNNVLLDISCVAQSIEMYVVCNVVEKDGNEDNRKYYSTSVVFNSEGKLILRCRKRYPYKGTNFDEGNQSQCTFPAKFKNSNTVVKFALLFDTDMLYAQEITTNNFILTSSIKNRLPLSYGLSLQQAFSVRNRVNLLSAGYSDLSNGYGGSGIYLKNGTSWLALSPDVLISEIPLDENKNSVINVDVKSRETIPSFNIPYEKIPTLNETNTTTNFTLKVVNFCKFNMKIDGNNIEPYKWVAFHGKREYVGRDIDHPVVCALMKPENKKDESKLIKELTISITLSKKNDVLQLLPISLASNKLPANFKFEETDDKDTKTTTMSLIGEANLLSFGMVVILQDSISSSSSIHVLQIFTTGILPTILVMLSKYFIFESI